MIDLIDWLSENLLNLFAFLSAVGVSIYAVPKIIRWLREIGRTVNSHDHEARELFENLAAWITERQIETKKGILQIKNDLNRKGFPPGTASMESDRVNELFDQNLRDYEKEKRKVTQSLSKLQIQEGLEHKLFRTLRGRPFPVYRPNSETKKALEDWNDFLVFGEMMAEPQ